MKLMQKKLIKIRVTQRRAAENTIDFSSDFPLETEALEIAEVRQLKSLLRAISVENEKVFSYIVSAGEGQRVRKDIRCQFRSAWSSAEALTLKSISFRGRNF